MRTIVMSGTSDSSKIIKLLSEDKHNHIIATTITNYGAKIAKSAGANEVISKALREEDFIKLIQEKKIDTLIDATHPFAAIATETAIQSSKKTNIKYIRFERPSTKLPNSDLIIKVQGFEEGALKAKELLNKTNKRLMHLAGVMTLPQIIKKVDPTQIIARVLPNTFSIANTRQTGIPAENIIAMQGIYSKEFNKALMKEYKIDIIITKESGETGGTENKIGAALELDIPIILVTRPYIKNIENEIVVKSLNELKKYI